MEDHRKFLLRCLDEAAPQPRSEAGTDILAAIDFSEPQESEYDDICRVIAASCHFPTSETATFLKRKCEIEVERGQLELAGISLIHAQGISFHHQSSFQQFRRIQKRDEDEGRQMQSSSSDLFHVDAKSERDTKMDSVQKEIMSLQASLLSENRVEQIIRTLPDQWRVVQINSKLFLQSRFKKEISDEAIKDTNFPLLLTQIDCGTNFMVKVIEAPELRRDDRPAMLAEFSDILASHRQVYKKNQKFDRVAYNQTRDELDDRLRSLLITIENRWLGPGRVVLLGRPKDPDRIAMIDEALTKAIGRSKLTPVQNSWLWNAFDGSYLLDDDQIARLVVSITPEKALGKSLAKAISIFGLNNCPGEPIDRHPVVLILDKDVQALPWEALPMMKGQQCSRVPSLFFLASLYASHKKNNESVAKRGVNNEKIFYVLNPNNDLKRTQERLESPFRQLSLGEGYVGEWPSFPKIQFALSEMDAFMYCGHGARMKTINSQEIEKLNIRALPLLFGCNSGRLERLGRTFDPTGTASSYLIASAPCLLGFLWSVTDVDIDKWTVDFLEHWLGKEAKEKDFVKAVAQRRHCFNRLLNSAATVIYGLPSFFDQGQ
eukprot:maker-scaffold1116_size61586-snap-gene-0.9 protein:Tk12131 transcript:maker-scaffold1116_size61586-snap-gene-0.9-mRNA-1 annotation:"hypothetical protein LOTGIDRAFT_230378"